MPVANYMHIVPYVLVYPCKNARKPVLSSTTCSPFSKFVFSTMYDIKHTKSVCLLILKNYLNCCNRETDDVIYQTQQHHNSSQPNTDHFLHFSQEIFFSVRINHLVDTDRIVIPQWQPGNSPWGKAPSCKPLLGCNVPPELETGWAHQTHPCRSTQQNMVSRRSR